MFQKRCRDEYRLQVWGDRTLEEMRMLLQESDRKITTREVGFLHDAPMKRNPGIYAGHDQFVQGTSHTADRFPPRPRVDDQFRKKWIIVQADLIPLVDSSVPANTGARGQLDVRDPAC